MALSKETLRDHLKKQQDQNTSKEKFVGRIVIMFIIVMGIGLALEVYFLLLAPFVATLWHLFFGPSIEEQLKMPEGYRPNSK